jgi:hypothetical protein
MALNYAVASISCKYTVWPIIQQRITRLPILCAKGPNMFVPIKYDMLAGRKAAPAVIKYKWVKCKHQLFLSHSSDCNFNRYTITDQSLKHETSMHGAVPTQKAIKLSLYLKKERLQKLRLDFACFWHCNFRPRNLALWAFTCCSGSARERLLSESRPPYTLA